MRVLVAEDDHHMRRGIADVLEGEGYEVVLAADGEEALARFESETVDFVCLDIMMPKMNGYDVCRAMRRRDETIPILFLSAKSEEVDKVLGLELGADDYVMKPFGVRELVARIRAVSRRCYARAPDRAGESFTLGEVTVLPGELRGRRGDAQFDLSLREVRILRCFFEHPGDVLHRDLLFRECWGVEHYPNSRTLDQHISKLRKKIEPDPKQPRIIQTVHGAGYRFEPE